MEDCHGEHVHYNVVKYGIIKVLMQLYKQMTLQTLPRKLPQGLMLNEISFSNH